MNSPQEQPDYAAILQMALKKSAYPTPFLDSEDYQKGAGAVIAAYCKHNPPTEVTMDELTHSIVHGRQAAYLPDMQGALNALNACLRSRQQTAKAESGEGWIHFPKNTTTYQEGDLFKAHGDEWLAVTRHFGQANNCEVKRKRPSPQPSASPKTVQGDGPKDVEEWEYARGEDSTRMKWDRMKCQFLAIYNKDISWVNCSENPGHRFIPTDIYRRPKQPKELAAQDKTQGSSGSQFVKCEACEGTGYINVGVPCRECESFGSVKVEPQPPAEPSSDTPDLLMDSSEELDKRQQEIEELKGTLNRTNQAYEKTLKELTASRAKAEELKKGNDVWRSDFERVCRERDELKAQVSTLENELQREKDKYEEVCINAAEVQEILDWPKEGLKAAVVGLKTQSTTPSPQLPT